MAVYSLMAHRTSSAVGKRWDGFQCISLEGQVVGVVYCQVVSIEEIVVETQRFRERESSRPVRFRFRTVLQV